jgi:hypothetical protein
MHEERQDVCLQLLNLLPRASAAPFILHRELQGRPAVEAQANSFLQGGGCLCTHHPPPQRRHVRRRRRRWRTASHLHLLTWLWRRRRPRRRNNSKLRFLPAQTLRVFLRFRVPQVLKSYRTLPEAWVWVCVISNDV